MKKSLQAGILSVALLALSRLLGLARESTLAATLGTTAVADVLVVMLTLPDLVTNILATGALGYVLLPWWARQVAAEQQRSQRRVLHGLWLLGAVLVAWVWLAPQQLGTLLAPGLEGSRQEALHAALRWAALALPASLTSALWYTRLQQDRDVIGMYGMNVVHTSVVILMLLGATVVLQSAALVHWMGGGLVAALLLRLAWLRVRLRRLPVSRSAPLQAMTGLPAWPVWAWAVLATGLPVALPVAARSLMSAHGEGALATFNYAWKLVELPSLFAIQLVTTLAFPAITRAHAEGQDFAVPVRKALVLAWTLACVAALGLHAAARPLADLLFGWGRMQAAQVDEVARWAAWGAWTLLPQALIAVLATVLATLNRMGAAALAYAAALLILLLSGVQGPEPVMKLLALAMAAVAGVMLLAAGREVRRALAWGQMLVPLAGCLALTWLARYLPLQHPVLGLALAALLSLTLLGVSMLASPQLRQLLRR